MTKLSSTAVVIALLLIAAPTLGQPTPSAPGSAPPAAPAMSSSAAPAGAHSTAGLPTVRHLVYRFGWNQKAADSGNNTGTTTVDIVGLAKDGGLKVTAVDDWWMAVRPKEASNCEVYPNGGVTCGKPAYQLTVIQAAVLPLLGRHYFAALSSGGHSTWKQSYEIRATFAAGANIGFAGQVHTWKCGATLTGKGTTPDTAPVILIHSEGQMQQEGGRATKYSQKANYLYDPRISMPVFVTELLTLVPALSTNSYSVELKLIKTGT